MEQNKFFMWTSRITSILFLLFAVIMIGFMIYGILASQKWGKKNSVAIIDEKAKGEKIENLRLGNITGICGKDVQYVELNSSEKSKGIYSGGYGRATRNIVFFVGPDMESHWLFDTDKYLITTVDQLNKKNADCKQKETISIYYQIIKNDTNLDGELNDEDEVTISLTSPDGLHYTELDSAVTSVIDHSVDSDAKTLTVLVQKGSVILMKKFSLESKQKISEKEISRIGKNL